MVFGIISHYHLDILPTGGGIGWRRHPVPIRTPPGRRRRRRIY